MGIQSSLEVTDAASAAVARAPRVSLADIEAAVLGRHFRTAEELITDDPGIAAYHALNTVTICMLVMRNGFVVIGKAAPASRENYDAELGRQFAYEDAVRQLWPLLGYALRERLESSLEQNQA